MSARRGFNQGAVSPCPDPSPLQIGWDCTPAGTTRPLWHCLQLGPPKRYTISNTSPIYHWECDGGLRQKTQRRSLKPPLRNPRYVSRHWTCLCILYRGIMLILNWSGDQKAVGKGQLKTVAGSITRRESWPQSKVGTVRRWYSVMYGINNTPGGGRRELIGFLMPMSTRQCSPIPMLTSLTKGRRRVIKCHCRFLGQTNGSVALGCVPSIATPDTHCQ